MKKLIFFLSFVMLLTAYSDAQKRQAISFTTDTITTSSSVDTITFSAGSFSAPMYYEWFLQAYSLSGSTNATAYLQLSAPGTSNYVTIETIVIDGVLTTSRKTGNYLRRRILEITNYCTIRNAKYQSESSGSILPKTGIKG